jgi:uridylate kinase
MGMLGTAINAIALSEALSAGGMPAAAMTAIDVPAYIERYHPRAAGLHLDAGRIVVLAGGVGNPLFTTDTTACLRAAELGCSRVLKATKVNGVFDADPRTNPGASQFEMLTATDAVNRRLGVMDLTAMTLAIENRLPIVVFNFATEGNIARAVAGDRIGTLITPD